jgi:ketosteroid isomerase-like protein
VPVVSTRVPAGIFFFLLFSAFVFADNAAQSLAQAELSFAHTASQKGIKDAFLAYLAEDSVLFRPRAVSGRQWMSDHPANPGVLIWEPSYAEVSGAGDLGFTTGPYSYQKSANDPPAYGQFFSIWKKQSDGTWKVFLDTGIDQKKEKGPLVTRTGSGSISPSTDTELKTVLNADTAFSESMDSENVIRLFQKDYGNHCSFKQDAYGIAKSADLAFVYGTFQCGENSGVYVRMWRKEGDWKVALDYRNS